METIKLKLRKQKNIALIAHDGKKQELINWCKEHYDILNKHISKAVSLLSGKDKDPENSIKESVSAVEYLCNVLAGTHNLTVILSSSTRK